MTLKDFECLEGYVDKERPFTPLAAEVVASSEAKAALFDSDLEIVSKYYKNRNVIIGRRGAGKTAFLESAYFTHPKDFIININKARCLGSVVSAVNSIPLGGRFPEAMADIWDGVIFTMIFSEAAKKFSGLKLTKDYLAKIGATSETTSDRLAWLVLDTLREKQGNKTAGTIAEFIRRLHNVSFLDAKKELLACLNRNNTQTIILIDSLESEGYVLDDQDTASALKGLLKWVGNISESPEPVHVHLSIPGEYYFEFTRLSSNPIKDFAKATKLRWRPKDLIRLSAKRYLSYLYFNEPQLFDTWKEKGLSSHTNALEMFSHFLPIKTTQKNGIEEDCFLYILRHTQLLPRQLFLILNAVFRESLFEKKFSALSVSEATLYAGHVICQEIFASFNHKYPLAAEACYRTLPYLPEVFPYGNIHKEFRHHAKALGFSDLFEFLQMLIDIGALGRVVEKTIAEERGTHYIQGQFQYNFDSPICVSSYDNLCIHPIFQIMFPGRQQNGRSCVYPVGI